MLDATHMLEVPASMFKGASLTARGLALGLLTSLALSSAGCASSSSAPLASPAPQTQRSFIAQPCQALRNALSTRAPAAVYLQIASVRSTLGQPLKSHLLTNPVLPRQIAAILLRDAEPAQAPWTRCPDDACTKPQDGTITVKATKLPAGGSEPLELELAVDIPGSTEERTVIQTRDQEPVIVPLPAQEQTGKIVLMPYFVSELTEANRRLMMECKSAAVYRVQPSQ